MKKRSLLLLGIFIVIGPWMTRNYYQTGKFTLVSMGGHNFSYSMSNTFTKSIGVGHLAIPINLPPQNGLSEAALSDLSFQLALKAVREQPVKAAKLYKAKLMHFLSPITLHRGLVSQFVGFVTFAPLLLGGFLWLFFRPCRTRSGLLIAGCALSYILIHSFFVTYIRCRLPVLDPVLIIVSAQLLAYLIERKQRKPMEK